MNVEHLKCVRCDTNPTVARIDGEARLVCHCTHEDESIDPQPLLDTDLMPPPWVYQS